MAARTLALFLTLSAGFVASRASAATSPADLESVALLTGGQLAIDAHRDGLAGVATQRLDSLTLPSDAPDRLQDTIRHLKIENLVRGGQPQKALDLLEAEELPFWRALALARVGRTEEAIPLLEICADDPAHPERTFATLTLASLRAASGDVDRAARLLEARSQAEPKKGATMALAAAEMLLDSGNCDAAAKALAKISKMPPALDPMAQVMLAEAALQDNRRPDALRVLEGLLDGDTQLSSSLHSRATLLLADAHAADDNRPLANAILKQFVESASDPKTTLIALDRMSQAGAFGNVEGRRLLVTWSEASNEDLAAFARYFTASIAVDENRFADAEALLTPLTAIDSPVALRAKLSLIRLHVISDDPAKAAAEVAKLKASTKNPASRARIEFVQARAQYADGDFVQAAENFTAAAGETTAEQATFNAALAALRSGDEAEFEARLALLPEVKGDRLRSDLLLERALLLASKADALAHAVTPDGKPSRGRDADADSKALDTLAAFIREHPDHPRVGETHLAVAGLELVAIFPLRPKVARDALAAAREAGLSDELKEQADYLAFWIEETSGETAEAVKLADAYLSAWPKSKRAAEVQMRQAESFFLNGDYLFARQKFEKVSTDYPDSPLADDALYFGGRAALLTRTEEGKARALALWQELYESGGELALHARRHQAQVRLNDESSTEAIALLDTVINAQPAPPEELKISCLLLRGRAEFKLGGKDAAMFEKAIESYELVSKSEGVSSAAANEALYLEGLAQVAVGKRNEALNCFQSIIDAPRISAESGEPPEFLWYHRAGFELMNMLTATGKPEDIDTAIAIAKKLAMAGGPRAAQARRFAEKLRLEHFRWDEE